MHERILLDVGVVVVVVRAGRSSVCVHDFDIYHFALFLSHTPTHTYTHRRCGIVKTSADVRLIYRSERRGPRSTSAQLQPNIRPPRALQLIRSPLHACMRQSASINDVYIAAAAAAASAAPVMFCVSIPASKQNGRDRLDHQHNIPQPTKYKPLW